MFTVDEVKTKAQNILETLKHSDWGYLIKQFPVFFDDQLSVTDKVNLDEHDTFSFANKYYIGFSESRCLKQVKDYYTAMNLRLTDGELYDTIKNVLIHEFGHILLEHVYQPLPKNDRDAMAMIATTEIETNRGVKRYERSRYFDDVAITDDKEEYKEVQPLITREAIYNKMKELYKPPKNDKNKDEKDEQNKEQDNDTVDNKNNKQKSHLPTPPSQSQTSSDQKEQDKPQSEPQSEPQKDECNDNGGGGEEQQDEQKQQVARPDNVGTMVKAMRQAEKQNTEASDLLTDLGLDPSDDFKNDNTIKGRLTVLRELSQNNEIKKTLSKIKGTLAGELNKKKVGTYSRPSRKMGEDGLMRRGTKRAGMTRPRILVALDESGSMDSTAVKTAATAIKIISKTIGRNRSDVKICKFDTSVSMTRPLGQCDDVINSYYPRGGTAFREVVRLAIQENCDTVICIGDGEDILPTRENLKDYYGIPTDCKYPKWIDVMITSHRTVDELKGLHYTKEDIRENRRETLWLGNNEHRVEQYAQTM